MEVTQVEEVADSLANFQLSNPKEVEKTTSREK